MKHIHSNYNEKSPHNVGHKCQTNKEEDKEEEEEKATVRLMRLDRRKGSWQGDTQPKELSGTEESQMRVGWMDCIP